MRKSVLLFYGGLTTVLVVIVIVLVIVTSRQYPPANYPYGGREDAVWDLRNGHLQLRAFGNPGPHIAETSAWLRIMREDYGVEVLWFGDPAVTSSMVENTQAYNDVMEAEIKRRFGRDIIEEARQKAALETRSRAPLRR